MSTSREFPMHPIPFEPTLVGSDHTTRARNVVAQYEGLGSELSTDDTPFSIRNRWGIVLAGGDGRRLARLTRLVTGDDRPKQFCPLVGTDSLLEQARRRAERSIPAERILYPVTQSHRSFYQREPGIRPAQRIVQPANKGTAPPIAYSLLSIAALDPDALVAVMPSDHHYCDEMAFSGVLECAFETAAAHRNSVVLLGSPARGPQMEFGWIELRYSALDAGDSACRVRGFCEKPSAENAVRLFEEGALWNTFVMVGHVRAFLDMIGAARTGLLRAFSRGHLWAGAEVQIDSWIYDRLCASDFSRDILANQTERLLALNIGSVGWSDLGHPERVIDVLQSSGMKPWWMKEWHTLKRAPAVAVERAGAAVA